MRKVRLWCVLVWVLAVPAMSWGGEVHVAVASNFLNPLKAIAGYFKQDTGDKLILMVELLKARRGRMIVAAFQGDWFIGTGLVLKPRVDIMWKGQDNITDPWPDNAFVDYPGILVGTVSNSIRPALLGRWRAWYADIEWDLGLNFIKNRGNQTSDWELEPTARVAAVLRKSWLR